MRENKMKIKTLPFAVSFLTLFFSNERLSAGVSYNLCEPWKKCCEATLCSVDGPGYNHQEDCIEFCRDVRDGCEDVISTLPIPSWITNDAKAKKNKASVNPQRAGEKSELKK